MGKFVDELIAYKYIYHANGVSSYTISCAEEKLGLHFSDEYKDYLDRFGVLSIDGTEFTGLVGPGRVHVVDITMQEREKNPNIPSDWYVVVFPTSDVTIWQTGGGEIFQVAADGKQTKKAASLSAYFKKLVSGK